jgi:hypothetical protein
MNMRSGPKLVSRFALITEVISARKQVAPETAGWNDGPSGW